jgi:hypothetical protein
MTFQLFKSSQQKSKSEIFLSPLSPSYKFHQQYYYCLARYWYFFSKISNFNLNKLRKHQWQEITYIFYFLHHKIYFILLLLVLNNLGFNFL